MSRLYDDEITDDEGNLRPGVTRGNPLPSPARQPTTPPPSIPYTGRTTIEESIATAVVDAIGVILKILLVLGSLAFVFGILAVLSHQQTRANFLNHSHKFFFYPTGDPTYPFGYVDGSPDYIYFNELDPSEPPIFTHRHGSPDAPNGPSHSHPLPVTFDGSLWQHLGDRTGTPQEN